MGKHAYCIIAHTDFYCLENLLKLIDDKRNDIYLLIDKKSHIFYQNVKQKKDSLIQYSNFQILHRDLCPKISWGDASQMKAELQLFKAVIESGNTYDYIHLISGSDLPIKSQDSIHDFFDNIDKGTNFIDFANDVENIKIKQKRVENYHFLLKWQKNRYEIFNKLWNKFDLALIIIQKKLHIKRNWKNLQLQKGTNWVSITQDFTQYLVQNFKRIEKKYKYIPCVDEIYKQTEIFNSEFRNTIFDFNHETSLSTRLIDWNKGRPYVWTEHDFLDIIKSSSFFARKFSSNKDKKIIDKIRNHLLK